MLFISICINNIHYRGWRGKDACQQAWWPEFNPLDLPGKKNWYLQTHRFEYYFIDQGMACTMTQTRAAFIDVLVHLCIFMFIDNWLFVYQVCQDTGKSRLVSKCFQNNWKSIGDGAGSLPHTAHTWIKELRVRSEPVEPLEESASVNLPHLGS